MADYIKATNFATKDNLAPGTPLKRVQGTELDNEFNAISTAVGTKADKASPNFTGTPSAPTASYGTNTTQLATTAFVQAALQAIYPVGTIYTSVVATNPGTIFGFGIWTAFATGRTLVGIDTSDTAFDTVEETGGSKDAIVVSHSHTATSSVSDPGHSHTIDLGTGGGATLRAGANVGSDYPDVTTVAATTGISISTSISSTGSSGTNANLPPYIVVYMWKRVA